MVADAPSASDSILQEEQVTIVSDTGVYLRATINDTNVSSSFLRRATAGEFRLCISHALVEEIRDVLTRPEI